MATDFKLVTSSKELEVGANYIIAAHYVNTSKGFNKLYVMNDAATSLNSTVSFTGIEVSNSNDQIISMPDGAAVFSLISNGDNFRLQYNGATVQGFLSAYWDLTSSKSPKNGVRIRTEETDYESITIDPASKGSQIKSIASGYTDATNFMLYVGYSGSSITSHNFKFYTTSSAGSNYAIAKLYKEVEPTDVASIAEYNALEAGTPVRFTCSLTITKAILGNIFVKDANGDFGCIYTKTTKDTNYPDGYAIPAGVTGLKGEDNRINAKDNLESIGTPVEGSAVTPKDVAYTALKNNKNLYGYVKVAAVPVVYNSSNSCYYAYSTDTSAEGMLLSVDGSGVEISDGKTYNLTGIVDTSSGNAFLRVFAAEEMVAAFAEPTISLEAGTYDEVKEVTITTTDGDYILYTTKDTDVLANFEGTLVNSKTATVKIDKSCTLRAIATNEEMSVGEQASATYVMKTATPTITAAEAVDGAYNNEEGKLEVTISCPKYSDNVIIAYSVDGVGDTFVGTSKVITINGTATVKATAFYADFDVSDEATATFTWNNPNVIENATVTGDIVFADQDAAKFIAKSSSMKKDADYILTDNLNNEYTITSTIGAGKTTYPLLQANGTLRLYNTNGNVIYISNNNITITKVAISHNRGEITINDNSVAATDGVSTWNAPENCHQLTIIPTTSEKNTDVSAIAITYVSTIDYYKVKDGAALIGMEKGKFYQVNVALEGVEANGGVLYARTTEASVAPSVPGKTGFDKSYEDYDLTKFNQRDWVAIKGLGSEYEGFALGTFIAAYDGEKLTSVVSNPAKSDAEIDITNINTFGAANVFYGNYENTSDFGWIDGDGNPYYPFFVKAKVNEVANFVGKVTKDTAGEGGSFRLEGSGKCGVFEGKGVLLEAADGVTLSVSGEDYKEFKGVLVAETNNTLAQCDVKIVALTKLGEPTGVAALKADGKATVYGTEGAVVVNGADGKVMIFDAMGRMVKSVNAEGAATVAMPAGYYIVRTAGTAVKVMVK